MSLPQSGGRLVEQQLHRSSRKTPCPICGRSKDSDCRWSDDWISCHSGAAANHLRPGQTLWVDGLQWYLAAVGAGHSGASHIYRPHTPQQRPHPIRNKPKAVTEDDLIVPIVRYFYRKLRPRVHASLRLPVWELCQPDELEMVAATFKTAQDLIRHLQQVHRIEPTLAKLLPTVRHWVRALSYQRDDLRRFQRDELGMQEGWK